MIALGRVERAVGLRGELRIRLYNAESRTLAAGKTIELRASDAEPGARSVSAHIEAIRYVKDAAVIAVEGVDSRDAAEALRGLEVCVARDALPALDEGEHYHVDLVGLDVHDGSGARIGAVTAVIAYPSVDALVVRTADDRSLELPIVPDVVLDVSMSNRVVTVDADAVRELLTPARPPRRRSPR